MIWHTLHVLPNVLVQLLSRLFLNIIIIADKDMLFRDNSVGFLWILQYNR